MRKRTSIRPTSAKAVALALLAPALLLGSIAAERPVVSTPCSEDARHPVVVAGESHTHESDATEDAFSVYVDPTTGEFEEIEVTVTLTWGVRVNDIDLDVNGEVSQSVQPVADAVETVTFSASNRCKLVTSSWAPFLASGPDSFTLTVEVK